MRQPSYFQRIAPPKAGPAALRRLAPPKLFARPSAATFEVIDEERIVRPPSMIRRAAPADSPPPPLPVASRALSPEATRESETRGRGVTPPRDGEGPRAPTATPSQPRSALEELRAAAFEASQARTRRRTREAELATPANGDEAVIPAAHARISVDGGSDRPEIPDTPRAPEREPNSGDGQRRTNPEQLRPSSLTTRERISPGGVQEGPARFGNDKRPSISIGILEVRVSAPPPPAAGPTTARMAGARGARSARQGVSRALGSFGLGLS